MLSELKLWLVADPLLWHVQPANSRKRLLSAVVVDGETRLPSQVAMSTTISTTAFCLPTACLVNSVLIHFDLMQDDDNMTAKRPRPDDSEDNPAAKKRNRRMFGFLNQTLQKCR